MPRPSYLSSMSHQTYVSSLYGAALLRLAQAVGLSQAGLAAYLGMSPVQVNYWARGTRYIPPAHLPLVVKRIKEALEHTLSRPGRSPKGKLARILDGVFHENLNALGFPVYPTFRDLLNQLTDVSARASAAPDITPYNEELKTIVGAVNLITGIINNLAELLGMLSCPELAFLADAMEDSNDDHDREEPQEHRRDAGVPGTRSWAPGEDS